MIHWKTLASTAVLAAALAGCAQTTPVQSTQATAPLAAPKVQRQALAQGLYELAFSPRQNAVFVSSSGGFGPTAAPARVLRLNPQTLAIEGEIPLERKAFGMAIDDAAGRVYIGNTVDTSVTVVDIVNNKVLGIVQLQQKTKGKDGKERYTHDLRELVVDPAANRLYVTGHSTDGSVLFVVDTRTLQVVKTVPGLGNHKAPGLAFDAAGQRVFASNLLGEFLTIDARSLAVTKRVNTGIEQPMNIAYDPATNRAFITDQGAGNIRGYQEKTIAGFKSTNPGNRVVVLDATTGAQLNSFPVAAGPIAVLFDAPRKRLFVTNREAGAVQVIDAQNYAVLQTIALPTHPNSMAFDPKANVLYVSVKNGEKDPKGTNESIVRIQF